MIIHEKIRADLFWFADFFRGGQVNRFLTNFNSRILKNSESDSFYNKDFLLINLLTHATQTVPFYNHILSDKLADFPIVNKTTIKSNSSGFLSSGYKKKKLKKATTSGSTGAPLTVLKDKRKINRHTAENIYFNSLAGLPLGRKVYYLRVWNAINRKSRLESFLQNIVMWDASDLSDKKISFLIETLIRDKDPKGIIAFASTLEAVASYIVRNKPIQSPLMSVVIAISETLTDGSRKVLEEYFKCNVISRYSNIENGFLAQQCTHSSGEYHINNSGFIIELLKHGKDESVSPGETGRIVVTDLFNYAMPLIRYDTGDMAIYSESSACGEPGPVFKKVEGRQVDFIYDTAGNLLSPHTITNTMWKYSALIRQFQFIQNSAKEYEIKINPFNDSFESPEPLIKDLKFFVGTDASVSVSVVSEIPVLSSGKRRKIVNNYKKP
jgi:phenylacetate-CoA ligase